MYTNTINAKCIYNDTCFIKHLLGITEYLFYISRICVIFSFIFNDMKSMNVCRVGLMFEGLRFVPYYNEKVRLGSAL